ncbi:hypothetical protein OPQ81_010458 [Rhizoctonia solani]|nr:hypothetical protein OPQ81_010458 [Rhizoctonia solani]
MGKRTYPASSARVASTMVSTLTAFFTFVIPHTVQLNSMLDVLMKDVLEIVGLTQASRHLELVEFGKYVEKITDQLIAALRNGQLAQHPNVLKNLEHLQKTLYTISCQISYINGSGGLGSRIRHVLFPEEDHIPRMRQRLNDALSVFHFGAAIGLLATFPNQPAGTIHVSGPGQPQPPDPSRPPAHERPRTQGYQAARTAEPFEDGYAFSPSLNTQSYTQGAGPPGTFIPGAGKASPADAEISIAFMNVERLRRSLRHSRSQIQTMELAAALGRLSDLLAKAGRTREALEISQESAGLYKSLAKRVN